jgi:hypothetical protein
MHLSPIRVTCPAHLSLLDLITLMIFREEYRAKSSLLSSLLHNPVTSSLSGSKSSSALHYQNDSTFIATFRCSVKYARAWSTITCLPTKHAKSYSMSTSLGLCSHSYAQNALLGHGKEIYYSNRGYAYVNGFPIFAAERTTPLGSHTKTKRIIATNPPPPTQPLRFAALCSSF